MFEIIQMHEDCVQRSIDKHIAPILDYAHSQGLTKVYIPLSTIERCYLGARVAIEHLRTAGYKVRKYKDNYIITW